jgi:hypothetical protein
MHKSVIESAANSHPAFLAASPGLLHAARSPDGNRSRVLSHFLAKTLNM